MFFNLRKELTNLLFHYYNAIGSLQRDINNPNIQNNIKILADAIKKTKETIFNLLDKISDEMNESKEVKMPEMGFFDEIPGFFEDEKNCKNKI
ncbi:hypothetical protein TUBRATIS_17820 [Tubulinosema ratisbonensis]|uniref:Uncharacterized protein n=1 Tax=Tubulinosema ratisbonensis TaxID=291195 RepID=A0A437AKN3_9MICR|nr:hypothetical protein TUBRATIS_17820 [Tubulinosema ratisbonensis]